MEPEVKNPIAYLQIPVAFEEMMRDLKNEVYELKKRCDSYKRMPIRICANCGLICDHIDKDHNNKIRYNCRFRKVVDLDGWCGSWEKIDEEITL